MSWSLGSTYVTPQFLDDVLHFLRLSNKLARKVKSLNRILGMPVSNLGRDSGLALLLSPSRGLAIAQAGLPSRRPGIGSRSGYVRFVVDKVGMEQALSEYFGFPCQFSFHRLLHTHHHHLSSGAGTVGPIVIIVPSGLSLNPSQERNNASRKVLLSYLKFGLFHFLPNLWKYIIRWSSYQSMVFSLSY
jgi:hypothetical protein